MVWTNEHLSALSASVWSCKICRVAVEVPCTTKDCWVLLIGVARWSKRAMVPQNSGISCRFHAVSQTKSCCSNYLAPRKILGWLHSRESGPEVDQLLHLWPGLIPFWCGAIGATRDCWKTWGVSRRPGLLPSNEKQVWKNLSSSNQGKSAILTYLCLRFMSCIIKHRSFIIIHITKLKFPCSETMNQRWAWTGLDILQDTCDFFGSGLDLDILKKIGSGQHQVIGLIFIWLLLLNGRID